ncbi:MAG: hypothetical protein M1833_000860 [Piccolia ochrophora]|nr:MAG: hypothetical protein M1833_000860 [Piccolia ochrophora]
MSFFGFNTALPRDRGHPQNAPGFGQTADPFAGVGRPAPGQNGDDDALDFEDTYDGLGDQLDESQDVFNDDTFGEGDIAGAPASVGKDFDFFGQTAQVSNAIDEEQMRLRRQQPPPKSSAPPPVSASKPTRTGYEKYVEPGYIPDLHANASLWGVQPKKAPEDAFGEHGRQQSSGPPLGPSSAKKMMSLEEVEAAMRAQRKKPIATETPTAQPPQPQFAQNQPPRQPQQRTSMPQASTGPPPQSFQYRNDQPYPHAAAPPRPVQAELPGPSVQQPQILQRQSHESDQGVPNIPSQPRQILQNPNRHSAQQGQPAPIPVEPSQPQHQRLPSVTGGAPSQSALVTHPQQLLHLSEEQRTAYLIEDAKRAKRNHKIYLLSRDNGLMIPSEKNFITRIQLQQLVAATGNPNEQNSDSFLAEDFYYQVHSHIRGSARQTPHQHLNQFAQTYLFQTGGRYGNMGRGRSNRASDNHQQRMEQQVQRAVEAAKLKPKNKQLVIEGSLGKISFSNAKTPKPLLNIRRAEIGESKSRQAGTGSSDRKSVLSHIENAYSIVMRMEDLERRVPPPIDENDPASVGQHTELKQAMEKANGKLWNELRVTDPIMPDSVAPHPFIAFLSFPKGKKSIPRIFRHLDQTQRDTVVTMIIFHVGVLDVVRRAQVQHGERQLPTAVREEIDLFLQTVIPSLFGYVAEAPLGFVVGLLVILLDRVDVQAVATTRVGLTILTMFLSRAELIKQAGGVREDEWQQWSTLYDRLFDSLESVFPNIFPGPINSGEDIYVWQFLAAIGIGASEQQQQRLVMAVSERVRETVVQSKTLPTEMASQRLDNVNLFLRAIGLDVELLG